MATLSLLINNTADRSRTLSNPPSDDIDMLVERNCSQSYVEAAMRVRALIEVSSLDSETLLCLARMVERQKATGTLARLMAAMELEGAV